MAGLLSLRIRSCNCEFDEDLVWVDLGVRLSSEVGVPVFMGGAMERGDTGDTWLDLPPTPRQTRWALGVAAVALAGFAAVVPIAGRPLTQLNAFFPSLDAIVFVSDLVTAVLLYAQFAISRLRALLALAAGYLFTALIVIPHALTFAGAFSPTGLLGANIQTGSWLFVFWHIGFSVGLLAYAMLTEEWFATHVSQTRVLPAIWCSAAGVVGLVCALTWLATAGATLLPPIILNDQRHISPIVVYPISFAILISLAALLLLLRRRRSVLGLWLMVVALVAILELAFSGLIASVRFSAGFYAGRTFSLLTASIVLIVLLAETTVLYMRLARTNAMLRREQDNKLMNLEAMASSIVHEIRQPLAAMSFSAAAGKNFLDRVSPDITEAKALFDQIKDAGFRASEVFENFLSLFRGQKERQPVDMNALALEAIQLLRKELDDHNIVAHAMLESELPAIQGNRGQLREVVLNLVQNSIEAMAATTKQRIITVTTARHDFHSIFISLQDTGPGIDPNKLKSIFDPFVTTKEKGTGLGLSICKMIIEQHGGKLSASSDTHYGGARFEVTLPTEIAEPSVTAERPNGLT
jgi:signal transduction histidine kinase